MNLFVGNFDFEHHLGPGVPRAPSAQIRRLNDEMAFGLLPLARPDDCLWTPAPSEPPFLEHVQAIGLGGVRFVSRVEDVPRDTELVPWGWCQTVKNWGEQQRWTCRAPDLAVVAQVNSREFSASLETEWDVGLPGARGLRTLAELDRAISEAAQANFAWTIKANFGMSARERILVRRSPPRPQDVEWARRRIAQGEPLFFEPWVEALAEFGCQFTIPPTGPPTLEGVTGLLTDAQGTYRGSRLLTALDRTLAGFLDQSVLDVVTRAAERIQQLGYFGPLGIDVMRYRTADGQIAWRPLQDINARLTMGRVALGWGRLLAEGECAAWLHLRRSSNSTDEGQGLPRGFDALPPGIRVIRTSPWEVGGRPAVRLTVLIAAQSPEALDKAFLTNGALLTNGSVHEEQPD